MQREKGLKLTLMQTYGQRKLNCLLSDPNPGLVLLIIVLAVLVSKCN